MFKQLHLPVFFRHIFGANSPDFTRSIETHQAGDCTYEIGSQITEKTYLIQHLCTHAFVAKVFRYGLQPELFATEKCEQSFTDVIDSKGVKQAFRKIVLALAYIHSLNVFHGTIKKSHLVGHLGTPKLTGFHSAIQLTEGDPFTYLDTQHSCLGYMAPESFDPVDVRITGSLIPQFQKYDIFALGCVFFEVMHHLPICDAFLQDSGQLIGPSFTDQDRQLVMNTPEFQAWVNHQIIETAPKSIDHLIYQMVLPNLAARPDAESLLRHPALRPEPKLWDRFLS